MSNKVVKDDSIRILLERREEIRNTINKLDAEYKALGDILLRLHHYEVNDKNKNDKEK